MSPPARASVGNDSRRGALRIAAALLHRINVAAAVVSGIALGVAGCVLTWESTARYLFQIPSDWQDEMSVFLLVGATFLSAAWVQERRGHVGIQALAAILPPNLDRVRRRVSDMAALAFCAFFCWKSWSLLIEAVRDGQTSNSAWGAPLWVPYSCMAVGMTLVVLEFLVQVLSRDALQAAGE